MRTSGEIIKDMDSATLHLRIVNDHLVGTSPVMRQSAWGRQMFADKAELVAKLNALRKELLAAGWGELDRQQAESVK